jgi:protoporphyrinogen oxidase
VTRPDVAVIGAGPAGLAAAWELAGRGASVVVLEASESVGGMAGTVERSGWRFDYGGHRFLTRWPELLERVRALLGADLLEVERKSVVVNEGRRVGYPLELADVLRRVPWSRGARYVASFLREKLLAPARDEASFEGWMTRRFGRALYADFFAPYTRKLWGVEPAALSSAWAPERIGAFDLGVALRALARRSAREPRTYARRFLYPRLGMGQLFDAIARDAVRLGARIERGARVLGLSCEGERVRAVRLAGREIEARHFIATLPLPELVRGLGGSSALRYRGLRFLNLRLDAPARLGSTWAYLSDGAGIVTRVQDPERRSPWMVPRGAGSLQLEIPTSPGDALWDLPDAALLARAWPELERAGVAPEVKRLDCASERLAHAYPIFDRAARGELERARAFVARFSNLVACGRQGGFAYVFSDRAMEQGIAAARRFLGVPEALPESGDPSCPTEATSLLG